MKKERKGENMTQFSSKLVGSLDYEINICSRAKQRLRGYEITTNKICDT